MDGETNENGYERFDISSNRAGMSCEEAMVKFISLKWFGHLKRIGEREMTRRVLKSRVDAVSVRQ